ncbi:uncharacterized protein LOC106877666 [Octopus bimaculoides]|uniref:Uncharacterized protein n=1 Tax=Octopus bimaculoides TaxID=37653 RepID=A0A0L8GD33_OCTBM|nr:uncharacterized protein LOC106877666 [Octopus bimaculoides]XP_014782101.1 uncharacterized protein LOC106877666 [Octopus bimaculoides]XP_052829683.1 uncharacterized protein LOC106877666 [Octopus bimaculoides]|eukprot:XP_014782100.1 PREDICTED: uncharacterized protein LOC106877666 [Octopus bimaculoides]
MAAMQMTITATGTLFLVITFIVILISLNTEAKELGNNCEIKISPDVNKILSRLVRSDKKVFNFEVHLSDKKLDDLLKPVSMDYFANARQFTWIPDVPDGLMAYKNFYYDFSIYSLDLLGAYIATPRTDIDINCGKQNIQRHDLIYLIFGELKRIVFIDTLKIGESGYMCFLINLSQDMKKNSPESFKAYRRLGINRELVKNYCCKLYKNGSNVYRPKSICSGNIMENSMFVNYANIVGAVLWAYFPLIVSLLSQAKLPSFPHQITLPYESEWINKKHNTYSFSYFLSWLFCFHNSSSFASRLRRFFCIIFSLSISFMDILMHYFFLYKTIKILFQDGIPLGQRSLILGISESYKNTDGFFGGPLVWLICYMSFNFILFVLPSRLSETIAYSTLHRSSTCTFLIQNKRLLEKYGSLNVSTLQDYDLLYAIMKANISTALNPSFWYLIIYTWFDRIKKIWSYYYKRKIFWRFVTLWPFVSITILFAVFFICELFLCLLYYGIPIVYLISTLPFSYSKVYIFPLYRNNNRIFEIAAVLFTILSFPFYILWALYSIYIFLTNFQILCSYIFTIAVAVLAKPDNVGDVWFVAMFFVYTVAIVNAVINQYQSVISKSIKLTKTVCPRLVQVKYGEEFINANLFKTIVDHHFPLRFEIGKSIMKLFLIVSFFFACNNIISREDLDLSGFTRITLILMTSLIPKLLSIINSKLSFFTSMTHTIIETIITFEDGNASHASQSISY